MKKIKFIFLFTVLLSFSFSYASTKDCGCNTPEDQKFSLNYVNESLDKLPELSLFQMDCDKIYKGRLDAFISKYGLGTYLEVGGKPNDYFGSSAQDYVIPGGGSNNREPVSLFKLQAKGELNAIKWDYVKCKSGRLGGGDPIWDMPTY